MKKVVGGALLGAALLIVTGCGSHHTAANTASPPATSAVAGNVDPGTPMNKPAPNFTLTDQFGHTVSLSQYRGHVVVLAFQDSECTTICPLTSQEMVQAKKMLGAKAASEVKLLAVDANPNAYSVADVYAYSKAHGTLNTVTFATGSAAQLARVWKDYDIYVAVEKGAIDHTPGVFVINAKGQETRLFLTQMAYAGIGQQAQMFAQAMARSLPHPTRQSEAVLHESLVKEAVVHQLSHVSLPAASGHGKVALTDGHDHLLVFAASWLSQLSSVPQQLQALNQYAAYAKAHQLPSPIVVDERPTEPSGSAFSDVLHQAGPLHYPTVIDTTGAVADAVGVQDLTWYAIVNAQGRVIWHHDGSNNWVNPSVLERDVAKAMH